MAIPEQTVTFNVKPKRPHVTAIWILAGLLFISLTGHYLTFRWNESREMAASMKEIQLLNENAVHKAASDSASAQVKRLNAKLAVTRDSAKSSHKRFVSEIKGDKKKLASLPQVIPQNPDSSLLDSIRVAFHLKDTIIAKQDDFIKSMELTHAAEIVDLNAIINLQAQQITSNMAIGENWRQMAENAQAGERRADKWRKFWKRTTGAVIVTAATVVTIVTLKE